MTLKYICDQTLTFRLEYEKKRDMGARIAKLESSQIELKNALAEVDEREKELKSTIEEATEEIDTMKEEIQGTSIFFKLKLHNFYIFPPLLYDQ